MAATPITLSTTLDSAHPEQEALARLRRMHWGSSVRLTQPNSSTLHVASGSRFRYRLLGVWLNSEHLPLKLVLRTRPHESGTSLDFALTSDEGWYLIQTSLGRDTYQARFDELMTALGTEGFVKDR